MVNVEIGNGYEDVDETAYEVHKERLEREPKFSMVTTSDAI